MTRVLEILFVMAPRQNRFFFELAETLAYEIRQHGVSASLTTSGFQPARRGRIYALVPPHEYVALRPTSEIPSPRLLNRTLFISAEQPQTPHFNQNVELARHAGAVFDISARGTRAYRNRGIDASHLRLGYSPYLDRFSRSTNDECDVLFLGCDSPRRSQYLGSYGPIIERLRTRLILSDNTRPNDHTSPGFVTGDAKLALLSNTKVLLNIHQQSEPYFEWLRALEAIHCGCVLVSEHSTDYEPLEPGTHFLSGRPEVLAYLAEHVVEDAGYRKSIREQAYQRIRESLPLATRVEELIEAASRIDRPIRATITTPGGSPRVDEYVDTANKLQPAPPYPAEDGNITALRRILKDIRLDLLDIRRQLLRTSVAADHGPVPLVQRHTESLAYRSAQPRVSVITALYNHASHICSALDSVATGRYHSFELIVVNDGSTDGSLERVRRWSAEHPAVPLLLLNHPVNRGLPESRNAGLDFARGQYCFILDADNEVYPHCLTRLVSALDAEPGVAFSYGALSAFNDEGYQHLLSHFPWQPTRLRRSNYIDAMALFRTDALRAVGGYTTDRRLYGWEDYDLYCRMAESDLKGRYCEQMVGRYRVSPTSMISMVNISVASAYSALKEHAPKLMEGLVVPS